MLSARELVPYLLEHGLLDGAQVVDGVVTIADVSRRNANVAVTAGDGPGYLVKQGSSADTRMTVANEAGAYQYLAGSGEPDMARYVPRLYGYDPDSSLLVLELVAGGEDFRAYHYRTGRFSKTLAAELGRALGLVHRATRTEEQPDDGWRPWGLWAHRPAVSSLRHLSGATVELVRILQRYEAFAAGLDDLRGEWRIEALAHNDLKWDNCIVHGAGETARRTRLKLVDWELARWGDPRYDVGCAFAQYLAFWASSIPVTGSTPPERYAELARHPIERMQPALGALWRAYVETMGLDLIEAREWLEVCVRYGAAALVHVAIERTQEALQLTADVAILLQLSLNMLARPEDASAHLLGIPWYRAVPA